LIDKSSGILRCQHGRGLYVWHYNHIFAYGLSGISQKAIEIDAGNCSPDKADTQIGIRQNIIVYPTSKKFKKES
jgi:hypothetical protein